MKDSMSDNNVIIIIFTSILIVFFLIYTTLDHKVLNNDSMQWREGNIKTESLLEI